MALKCNQGENIMPVPYPTLTGNESTNLFTLTKFVNDGAGGIFMPLTLLSIWFIAFIGAIVEGRQASRAFIFASFICSILGILLALIGLLASQYMYFCFLLVGVGLIWSILENAPGS
jgi:hypothetical protein